MFQEVVGQLQNEVLNELVQNVRFHLGVLHDVEHRMLLPLHLPLVVQHHQLVRLLP